MRIYYIYSHKPVKLIGCECVDSQQQALLSFARCNNSTIGSMPLMRLLSYPKPSAYIGKYGWCQAFTKELTNTQE